VPRSNEKHLLIRKFLHLALVLLTAGGFFVGVSVVRRRTSARGSPERPGFASASRQKRCTTSGSSCSRCSRRGLLRSQLKYKEVNGRSGRASWTYSSIDCLASRLPAVYQDPAEPAGSTPHHYARRRFTASQKDVANSDHLISPANMRFLNRVRKFDSCRGHSFARRTATTAESICAGVRAVC
jgi:hypothetical protein